MKIELFDRHAENVDESIPLCDHHGSQVKWGDTFTTHVHLEMPGWFITSQLIKAEATIEIHLISTDHIKIIVNHADYLAAKQALEASKSENL